MLEEEIEERTATQTIKAILTDVQFWVPALVLSGGVMLLIWLH